MSRSAIGALAFAMAVVAIVVVSVAVASPVGARLAKPVPHACDPTASPCLAVRNEFVRADIGPAGSWAMGTTGGDPSTPQDDDSTLVYGFKPGGTSDIGSSYTTVRVSGRDGDLDISPTVDDVIAQTETGDRVDTVWQWSQPHDIRVTETLRLLENPFSGRRDGMGIEYVVSNDGSTAADVGIRALVDVKLGRNDGAPYIVPGVGAVTTERSFSGDDVPPFWQAFESPTYDPRELRSVGILDGEGLTVPDRFLIAYWFDIQDKLWDYPVDVTKPITRDSAVALFWNPTTLAPGERVAFATGYGLAGDRGGSAFLSGPVSATCGEVIPVSLFVTNFDTVSLTGGEATLSLPVGLSLSAGETPTKTLAAIAPGATGSAVWQVDIGTSSRGTYSIGASADFDADRSFNASYDIEVSCPQETPDPTATSTHTATATATATPPPTPTSTPVDGPRACDFLQGRVPPSVIAAALANPARVLGWDALVNPSAPESMFNPRRRMLSLQNIGVPYHILFNPVVYKAGCP